MVGQTLLRIEDLRVRFESGAVAVDGVSLSVARGETLALVGESGSGKSVTALSIMRLMPPPPHAAITGHIAFNSSSGEGFDLLGISMREMRALRARKIAMIFQEPMTAFSPVHTIGQQLTEAIRLHLGFDRIHAWRRAAELLEQVGIPEPGARLRDYPHQLSGGMRQRAMIAMALSCDPELIIADEPTTALDVTVQAQILDLLRNLRDRSGMAMIIITHNLGVVSAVADRCAVMYAGRVVEQASVSQLFTRPTMPYTRALLSSVPTLQSSATGARVTPIIGEPPDTSTLPSGCAFHPRCPDAVIGLCDSSVPQEEQCDPGHHLRCVRWRTLRELRAAV